MVGREKRLILLATALLLAVAVIVVNATVFAYRWMEATVSVAPPGAARGAACTGFYSVADQPGITLPSLGTNAGAPTYGGNRITVTPGQIVCTWTVGGTTYKLYESISVNIPVTVGAWYIQDFYAFGYNGTTTAPNVYVYFRVEDDATDGGILNVARLVIKRPDGSTVAVLDLLSLGATTSAIELSPGSGLRLDLFLVAASSGTVAFKVGVYVTQESGEAPSP